MSVENSLGDSHIIVEKLANLEDSVRHLQYKVDHCTDEVLAISGRQSHSDHDKNPERGNWCGKAEYLVSCLGYTVGLGNIWRFPYLCYKNGGGAFLVPYCVILFFVGIPLCLLELALGQFSSRGPLTCWQFAPVVKGIGVAMMIVTGLVAIYYNMIIAWSMYYLYASCTTDLPWSTCGDWSSPYCSGRLSEVSYENCTGQFYNVSDNGVCYMNGSVYGIWNKTLAKSFDISLSSPAEDYLNSVVLGLTTSSGIGDVGLLRWELVVCYVIAWILVVFSLINGIKSSGKVAFFTVFFSYIMLIILLIRGVTLPGYMKGIEYYITPDLDKLKDGRVWKDAAVQVFFSLSTSWGGLIALSSYNKFHNDIVRDTFFISIVNLGTSLLAGFVVFSFLGYMSTQMDVSVDDVVKNGVTLIFVVVPSAISTIPVPTLWAVLFFLMLITLGIDTQFTFVETLTTAINDQFPNIRPYRSLTNFALCIVLGVLGLTLCTDSGVYWLELMDHYAGGWNVLLIAVCECWAVTIIYGTWRFLADIEVMLGYNVCGCCSWAVCRFWWAITWVFITPLGTLFIFGLTWYYYEGAVYEDEVLPLWANSLGWLMLLAVLAAILITPVILFVVTPGSFSERAEKLFHPTIEWGPALVHHRKLIMHSDIVIDPWGNPNGGRSSNGVVLVSKSMPYAHREGITNPIYDTGPRFYQSAEDPSIFIVPELERKAQYISSSDQPPNETSTPRFTEPNRKDGSTDNVDNEGQNNWFVGHMGTEILLRDSEGNI